MINFEIDNKELSKSIREQKKKIAKSKPIFESDSPPKDFGAQNVYDIIENARIEETLKLPKKSNSDIANLNADDENPGIFLSDKERARMGRIRKYFDSLGIVK